jgi:hypothetical protein
MNRFGELDDPRRRVLIQALAAGLFSLAGDPVAQIFGTAPRKLPAGQSFYRVSGRVLVNNQQATLRRRSESGILWRRRATDRDREP